MWHFQMQEIKAQLAATCEPRQVVNATFDRVLGLVEEAAKKALSMERLGAFYVSSSASRDREAKRLQDEVRRHGAGGSVSLCRSCHGARGHVAGTHHCVRFCSGSACQAHRQVYDKTPACVAVHKHPRMRVNHTAMPSHLLLVRSLQRG